MAFKSQLLWTGLGTGVLGSMIAPPGEKRQGFSRGLVLGMGGKALLEHPKVRSTLGIDEWKKSLKGETDNITESAKKVSGGNSDEVSEIFDTSTNPNEAKKRMEETLKKDFTSNNNVQQNTQQNVTNQTTTTKTQQRTSDVTPEDFQKLRERESKADAQLKEIGDQLNTSQSKILISTEGTHRSKIPINNTTNYETSFLHPGAWRHEKYGSFNDIRKARNAYFEWLRG